MKELLRYAHCTKFTPGCLDCAPHSAYELREVEAKIIPVHYEDEREWQVRVDGKVIAQSERLRDAEAIAVYELMRKSRDEAYHAANVVEVKP